MALTINQAPARFFQIGSTKIEDISSDIPFNLAFELLCKTYPQVRHSHVFESDAIPQPDGSILYVVPMLPAKTNG